jgi:hypothetical protein
MAPGRHVRGLRATSRWRPRSLPGSSAFSRPFVSTRPSAFTQRATCPQCNMFTPCGCPPPQGGIGAPLPRSEWTAICLLCAETYIERRFCPLERAGVFFGNCPKCCAAVASFRFLCDKPPETPTQEDARE